MVSGISHRAASTIWWLALVATVGLLTLIVTGFSFDMDEFLPYHTIACEQPGQVLSVYQGACNDLPTQFLGWEFQRSFNYAGEMSAWLMTPVFAIWHSWWAHALVGVIALVLAAWGVVRSLGLQWRWGLLFVAFLPIAFPVIHDTGPVRLSLIAIAWSPAAIRFMLSPARAFPRVLVGILLTLLWVASTENKPFFLYLIPGAIAWIVACLYYAKGRAYFRDHVKGVIAWFIGLPLACAALLFVLRTDGVTYFEYLRKMGRVNDPIVNAGTALTFLTDWPFSAQRFVQVYPNVDQAFPKLLQSPINALPMTADRGGLLALALTLAAILGALILVAWCGVRVWRHVGRGTLILLAVATATLLAGAWISLGGSVHHFLFAQLGISAIVILGFTTIGKGEAIGAATVAALSWLAMAAILTTARNPAVGSDVDNIMEAAFERASQGTIINCASWGCYHQFAFLQDKPAPVVFAETPAEQAQLAQDAREGGFSVIHVCRGCESGQVQQNMQASQVQPLAESRNEWRAFAVTP